MEGNNQLSKLCRKEIEKPKTLNFVSIVSFWEISIKVSIGKLDIHKSFDDFYALVEQNNFKLLPISPKDTFLVASLPFHHRDPFDRLIIAQAINNNLNILSRDENFKKYDASVIW